MRATASTATPASSSARWASTSATAISSNASPARFASTPATTSWRKVGSPKGLISYTTLRDYNTHAAEAQSAGRAAATAHQRMVGVSHIVRPRTLIYAGLWSLIGLLMLFALLTRDRLDINVLPDRNPLFVTLSDGSIRNGYTLKILNMLAEPRQFTVSIRACRRRSCGRPGPPRLMLRRVSRSMSRPTG